MSRAPTEEAGAACEAEGERGEQGEQGGRGERGGGGGGGGGGRPPDAARGTGEAPGEPIHLTDDLLRGWRLPAPDAEGDKEARGQVLVIAGSREMPGAALLSARAALRAGAGKLSMAVPRSIARGLALQIPEARVIAMPETKAGGLAPEGAHLLEQVGARAAAVLIGPGMQDEDCVAGFLAASRPLFTQATVVLDALAMEVVRTGNRFEQPVVLTPHAGEMAGLTGTRKDEIASDPARHALAAARQWCAVVVLKGATTCIAAADGRHWQHCCRLPGLATSGSGDVLAGALAGMAAQGAPAEQAAAWAVAVHARSGAALAEQHGTLGYLASEICDALPAAMRALSEHRA
jgi:ADP-dependent NAD(P)H-hydrate dehydratase